MFFFLPYLQQFHCLVLIYQQRSSHPLIKATTMSPPPSLSIHHGINIVFIIIFLFLSFWVATQQRFIKRLKYTLDYIENEEFTVLQDVIKVTT